MILVKTPYIMGYASHFSIQIDPPRYVLAVTMVEGLRIGVATFETMEETMTAYNRVFDGIVNGKKFLQFEECHFA